VAEWLGSIARELSNKIELTLSLLHAPRELAGQCKAANGKVCMVTATAFADSEEEARTVLGPLGACPAGDPLLRFGPEPTDFPALFDLSGSMWPELHRAQVDAMFYDASPATLVAASHEHFLNTPSEVTLVLFSIYTGPDVPAPLPDCAFSMSARVYGGPWTMWTEPSGDSSNVEWHLKCVELLQPLSVGHYIGESDTVRNPEFAQKAYSVGNWRKLEKLRKRYDPDGVFYGYTDGL